MFWTSVRRAYVPDLVSAYSNRLEPVVLTLVDNQNLDLDFRLLYITKLLSITQGCVMTLTQDHISNF